MLGIIICFLACLVFWAAGSPKEGAVIPVFPAASPVQYKSEMGACLFSKCTQDRVGRVRGKQEGQERRSWGE